MPRAPRASASARPTRRPAPVTITTRPASAVMDVPSCGGGAAERRELGVLPSEPLGGHLHHANRAGPIGRAMPVGATAHHEAKLLAQSAQPRGVRRRVTRVLDLDPVEPERAERFDPLARAAGARMR